MEPIISEKLGELVAGLAPALGFKQSKEALLSELSSLAERKEFLLSRGFLPMLQDLFWLYASLHPARCAVVYGMVSRDNLWLHTLGSGSESDADQTQTQIYVNSRFRYAFSVEEDADAQLLSPAALLSPRRALRSCGDYLALWDAYLGLSAGTSSASAPGGLHDLEVSMQSRLQEARDQLQAQTQTAGNALAAGEQLHQHQLVQMQEQLGREFQARCAFERPRFASLAKQVIGRFETRRTPQSPSQLSAAQWQRIHVSSAVRAACVVLHVFRSAGAGSGTTGAGAGSGAAAGKDALLRIFTQVNAGSPTKARNEDGEKSDSTGGQDDFGLGIPQETVAQEWFLPLLRGYDGSNLHAIRFGEAISKIE